MQSLFTRRPQHEPDEVSRNSVEEPGEISDSEAETVEERSRLPAPLIYEIVRRLNRDTKVSFLLAEQNTNIVLRYADYGYILENGRVVMDGAAERLRANDDVKEFYLGLSASGRKSYRDVKHYRRRKRWLT